MHSHLIHHLDQYFVDILIFQEIFCGDRIVRLDARVIAMKLEKGKLFGQLGRVFDHFVLGIAQLRVPGQLRNVASKSDRMGQTVGHV